MMFGIFPTLHTRIASGEVFWIEKSNQEVQDLLASEYVKITATLEADGTQAEMVTLALTDKGRTIQSVHVVC